MVYEYYFEFVSVDYSIIFEIHIDFGHFNFAIQKFLFCPDPFKTKSKVFHRNERLMRKDFNIKMKRKSI